MNLHWREMALCVGADPEWWFPTPGEQAKTARAIAICHDCPVAAECEAWASSARPKVSGIWAGRLRGDVKGERPCDDWTATWSPAQAA